jgi:hypothetical protein
VNVRKVKALTATGRMRPPGLAEVDYGAWTGRELKVLAKEPLWKVVQQHPSAAVLPVSVR